MKLRIRKEDAENVDKLRRTEDVYVLETPEEIAGVFEQYFSRH
jgi:flavoprotein